jgi:soluble lytic murein transglycosylase-like protein
MRFCFSIALGLGALAVHAAGLPESGKVRPGRIVSEVRADPRSGKLVRVVVNPAAPSPVRAPRLENRADPIGAAIHPAISRTVDQVAAEHSLPPELIHSVIKVESNYDPFAVSPKGALGLMQLIPAMARRFGVLDAFDPLENIRGGAKYLRYLLDLYAGNYTLALAAYNAGEGAVARYGDVPPYPETRNYVDQIGRRLQAAAAPPPALPDAAQVAVPAAPKGPAHIQQVTEADGTVRYVSR